MGSDGVQEQLKAKHPERTEDVPDLPARNFDVVAVQLRDRYRRLAPYAGTGPDKFRNEYLAALTLAFTDDKASKAVAEHQYVAGLYINAQAPGWVYELTAAEMLALVKAEPAEGEVPDVRPIAMGGVRERERGQRKGLRMLPRRRDSR